MRDAVLATALTLCMCEIHSGADVPRSWRLHLEGANAILSSLAPSSTSTQPNSQTGLLERWYTSIEALAAISSKGLRAGDLQPASSPAPSTSSLLNIDFDKRDEVDGGGKEEVFLDDYFGFSTDLVGTFKETGALAWERRAFSSSSPSIQAGCMLSEEDLLAEARSLEFRILDMLARDAASPPSFYPGVREQLSEDVIKEFYLSNEAYQYSALLHIYRRVMLLERADERVQGCVDRILGCVEGIEKRGGLSLYIVLTMPLFTAGREAMEGDRERVRGLMGSLARETSLRNVWRSLEFMESGWEREGKGEEMHGMCLPRLRDGTMDDALIR
jgi:hypothetical protein